MPSWHVRGGGHFKIHYNPLSSGSLVDGCARVLGHLWRMMRERLSPLDIAVARTHKKMKPRENEIWREKAS